MLPAIGKTLRIRNCVILCCGQLTSQKYFAHISFRELSCECLRDIQLEEAVCQLNSHAYHPDTTAYASLLRAAGNSRAFAHGRRVHDHIVQNIHICDRFVGNLLIQMYGKCRALEDALSVFDHMDSARNVFSWTIMIGAYAQHGHNLKALHLYERMQEEGVKPDKITFITALGVCSSVTNLALGMEIHESIVDIGYPSDAVVMNALLNLYGKCGSLENAQKVFDQMDQPHVFSWNSMIAAYSEHGQSIISLHLYQQMLEEGVMPDLVTFINILSACSSLSAQAQGKCNHVVIINREFESDVVMGTALINMYDKCGSVLDAFKVFNKMQERDVVSWNSMISAYAQHGHNKEACELYCKMHEEGVKPNQVTFISMLGACAISGALVQARDIHDSIEKAGFESNVILGTALIDMYGKHAELEDASRVFGKLHGRNVVSWTAIISAYAQHGHGEKALDLYQQMLTEGVEPNAVTFVSVLGACSTLIDLPKGKEIHVSIIDSRLESDVFVGTALIDMYSKFGILADAKMAFDKLHLQNEVSWTTIIAAHVQHGHYMESLLLYQQMQDEGVTPDKYTFVNVLVACSSLAVLPQGKGIHDSIVDHGLESDVTVGTALIDMYGACASLEDAWRVLLMINDRNVFPWTAMIAAYAYAGQGRKALHLFQQMRRENVKPDGITFLSVLCACSHAGLVDEGWCYFGSMKSSHGIIPTSEHYACMVDLIGRAGRLDEAENFILQMPVEPDVIIWRTFLGACRVHGDTVRGKLAADHIVWLDPQLTASYVLLSNLFAADVRQDVAKLKKAMIERCEEAAWGQLNVSQEKCAWI